MEATLRCALVGPARTRDGLGPFLARFLEDAGLQVRAVVGRDAQRTLDAAQRLGLRRVPRAYVDLRRMLGEVEIDALVIASPPAAHLEGLRAAAATGLHVLCEKPLVPAAETSLALPLVAGLAAAGRMVAENCQWPFVLPDVHGLLGRDPARPPHTVAMRLSPSSAGRAMLEDSLSHFLSVLQELLPGSTARRIDAMSIVVGDDAEPAEAATLRLDLAAGARRLAARLELRRRPQQPREAWIEIDGRRVERRIRMADYAMSLVGPEGDEVGIEDPMRSLVYGFAADLTRVNLDRIRTSADRVRERAEWFRDIVARWPERRETTR